MSRFSKAEAEKAGWSFTHDSEAQVLFSGGQQGVTRVKAASVRAEKIVTTPSGSEQLITEEADTLGLLLERIHGYEQFQGALESVEAPAPAPALVDEVKVEDGVLKPTGEQVSSVTGEDVDSAALARDEENSKSSEPAVDPEGEATPQEFGLHPVAIEEEPEAPKKRKRVSRRKKAK